MTGRPTRVVVSSRTHADLAAVMPEWLELVRDDDPAADDAAVLWRRQQDRTSWCTQQLQRRPVAWLHTDTAGVDRLPLRLLQERGTLLTNARGAYTPAVAEWALGAVFLAAKRFDEIVRRSDARVWDPPAGLGQLHGAKVVVFGYGSIGEQVGRSCAALGMQVVGVARRPRPAGGDDPVRVLSGGNGDWLAELDTADLLVLTAPLTATTAGVVDAAVLSRLRHTAWLVNVGRGELVDEAALAASLDAGRMGGAVLDVFRVEPLPATSPLWGRTNVVVSPHASGTTQAGEARTRDLFLDEATRFRADRPFRNAVDLEEGY